MTFPTIRQARADDRRELIQFLSVLTFPVSVEEHVAWLYDENPHGVARTWLALREKTEEIVGCTSIFPRRFWMNGRTVLAATGGDTLVHPSVRGRGIATSLHGACIRDMGAEGIYCEFGFPNPPNLRAMMRAGALVSDHFRTVHQILDGQAITDRLGMPALLGLPTRLLMWPLLRAFLRLKRLPPSFDHRVTRVTRFDDRFDALAHDVLPTFSVCGVRDSAWLHWRYIENPAQRHVVLACEGPEGLDGFAVLELVGRQLHVFDFFCRRDPAPVQALLGAVTRYAIEIGASHVTALVNPMAPYADQFRRAGYAFPQKLRLECLRARDTGEGGGALDLKTWYLAFGDQDLESISGPAPTPVPQGPVDP
jgi:GNAT superfamily N-acetyltransferase